MIGLIANYAETNIPYPYLYLILYFMALLVLLLGIVFYARTERQIRSGEGIETQISKWIDRVSNSEKSQEVLLERKVRRLNVSIFLSIVIAVYNLVLLVVVAYSSFIGNPHRWTWATVIPAVMMIILSMILLFLRNLKLKKAYNNYIGRMQKYA